LTKENIIDDEEYSEQYKIICQDCGLLRIDCDCEEQSDELDKFGEEIN